MLVPVALEHPTHMPTHHTHRPAMWTICDPTGPCLCGSGNAGLACCLDEKGGAKRAPSGVLIANGERGDNHKSGCYAAAIGGCEKLSEEHYYSHALLRRMTGDGGTLEIQNTLWLPKGEKRHVPRQKLTARVLCGAHNEALAPYDAVGDRFCGLLMEAGRTAPTPITKCGLFNGDDVEGWMLKTLCGVAAMESRVRNEAWAAPLSWLELLFKKGGMHPPGFGLFIDIMAVRPFSDGLSLGATPVIGPDGGDPVALRFHFCGFEFVLMTGNKGRSSLLTNPRFRPGLLEIDEPGRIKIRAAIRYEGSPLGVSLRIAPPPTKRVLQPMSVVRHARSNHG
jgi:hypothetical protein